MEIRKLDSNDIYEVCGIIEKIGIDEFKEVFSGPEMQKLVNEDGGSGKMENQIALAVTFNMASIVLKNLKKAKSEINSFLASLTGTEKEEIEKLPPAKYTKLVIDLFKSEDFSDFIGVVSELFK